MLIRSRKQAIVLLFLFACVYIATPIYSQSVNKFLSKYMNLSNVRPSELIYFQTSKGIYETGEDLWFKAYQLDAQTFGLSDKSKTLYLQMLNSEDSVVWQEKYPIENGLVSGHIYVSEKLLEGDYFLKGYTKYSFYRNDTLDIVPTRKIKIVRNIVRSEVAVSPKDTTFCFKIFPEGGNLVSGLLSKLAFKATDGKGNPVFFEGAIYQDDKLLCEIKSSHYGMGAVLFTPSLGRKYSIKLKNGESYLLPDIYPQGMVLRLAEQNKKQLNFVVSQSGGLPKGVIYLMGQMRGMICYMAKGMLMDSLRVSIPLDRFLYQGIVEFTLLDSLMRPVAERLVYVHPQKKLYINAEPDKKSFFTREKGIIKIKVVDEEGRPVRANLGISVFDRAYKNPADPMTILSYCYLSSQIRGKIYNPTYYFDEKNNDRQKGMELLLLTQGWRRYIWDTEQLDYQGQPFLTDEINGIQTVKVKGKKKGEQDRGGGQLLLVCGADGNSHFIWTDSIGHFWVNTKMMKALRGGYVYLKPMLSKEFKPTLKLTDYFPLIDSIRRYRQDYYPIADLTQYKKQQITDLPVVSSDSTVLLNQVMIMAKGRKPFRDKMMGRLDSLAQINLSDAYVCGCGYLQNYKLGYDAHPWWKPCHISSDKRTKPIEGKKYEVVKFQHLGGSAFSVIDSQTVVYHANHYSEEELLMMNNLWRAKGYYASRDFYQPDEIDIQSSIPDPRNTLLWAPNVITDEKGEAEVSFYCSDINAGFVGVVEGVDGAGLLGNTNCEFRVIRK